MKSSLSDNTFDLILNNYKTFISDSMLSREFHTIVVYFGYVFDIKSRLLNKNNVFFYCPLKEANINEKVDSLSNRGKN